MRAPADRLSAALCAVVPTHALYAVVPAKAGTHIPEPVVMGPRFRGDDSVDQADLA
jgi:hypothetical protein